ncbi:hypothetical protein [Microbulbifer taiwanensis]|uniref:hypothetical protein n=1 Tax=Microbulbifer taiwanensis TaxID=986746 RepID=UPI00361EE99C
MKSAVLLIIFFASGLVLARKVDTEESDMATYFKALKSWIIVWLVISLVIVGEEYFYASPADWKKPLLHV